MPAALATTASVRHDGSRAAGPVAEWGLTGVKSAAQGLAVFTGDDGDVAGGVDHGLPALLQQEDRQIGMEFHDPARQGSDCSLFLLLFLFGALLCFLWLNAFFPCPS